MQMITVGTWRGQWFPFKFTLEETMAKRAKKVVVPPFNIGDLDEVGRQECLGDRNVKEKEDPVGELARSTNYDMISLRQRVARLEELLAPLRQLAEGLFQQELNKRVGGSGEGYGHNLAQSATQPCEYPSVMRLVDNKYGGSVR